MPCLGWAGLALTALEFVSVVQYFFSCYSRQCIGKKRLKISTI